MIVAQGMRFVTRFVAAAAVVGAIAQSAHGQNPVARITVEPAQITTQAGKAASFKVTAYDAAGAVIANPGLRIQGVAATSPWARAPHRPRSRQL